MRFRTVLIFKVCLTFITTGLITGCTDVYEGELVGLDRFDQVHELIDDHIEQELIAGASALVIQNGEIIYRDHIGWMDIEINKPISNNTIHRIASMTKAVTTVAIMMLDEQGLIELSDPVSDYIPAFSNPEIVVEWETNTNGSISAVTEPANREITIHDLLSHTSGITYSFTGGDNFASLYQEAGITDGLVQTDLTLAEYVTKLAPLPLMHQPGTAWQYGLSHDVLGRVVEVVSGETLDSFYNNQIFSPLGMDDTHFYLPEDKLDRLATLYTLDSDDNIVPAGENPVRIGNLVFSSNFHYEGPEKFYSGGAGLVSTISDYSRFLRMLQQEGELEGTRILEPESVRVMTQNQIGSLSFPEFGEHGDKFGYGFAVVTEAGKDDDISSVGSYSWGGTFNTYYWVDPEEELVGVLMTQLYPYGHLTLRKDFKETVYDVLND